MKILDKLRTAQQQKSLYKQLIKHGIPKRTAQNIINFYKETEN